MSTRIASSYLCLISFFIISSSAFAVKTVERSCDAHYEIIVTKIDGGTIKPRSSQAHKFYARRGCGRNVPNRCRERARDAAHTCMQKHWNTRSGRKTPTECLSEGVKNYKVKDLKAELKKAACSVLDPYDYRKKEVKILFTINRVTRGDKKCGKRKKMRQDYPMWCSCPFGKACGGE